MRKPPGSYIICSTPRTGSTRLCSLLKSTGCAGVPESYFRAQDFESRALQWNIRQPDGSVEFRDFLECVLERGSTPHGLFAVRIMWGTLAELLANLRLLGLTGSDCEVLKRAFGPTKFVFLERQDKLAQAVSRLRAEQTNIWHITNQTDLESRSAQASYDRPRIEQFLEESIDHNRAWESWFARNGVVPLRVSYEELDRDGEATARKVLNFLGVSAPGMRIEAPELRMADSLNHEWADRFRTETGYQD